MERIEIVLPAKGNPDVLRKRTRVLPALRQGEVHVQVEATGVSFAEQQMLRGRYPDQPRFPFVPGYDVVGRIATPGPGVTGWKVGQRVAAVTKVGGWVSDIVLPAADLIAVPEGLDPAEVEAVLVNGVTAWQMLDYMPSQLPGQTVLVHGASGGVGTLLVQLAGRRGARVIGTASARQQEVVRGLGAIPLDYRDAQLERRIRELAPDGVDGIFDPVGMKSLQRSWRLLKRGGVLVAYGTTSTRDASGWPLWPLLQMSVQLQLWSLFPNGRHATMYYFWAGKVLRPHAFRRRLHDDLTQVLALLAAGTLRPCIARRLPLEQAADALRLAESGTAAGKIVLMPSLG